MLGLGNDEDFDVVEAAPLRAAFALAHAPAFAHLCEVSDLWSRQNFPWHDSHRKGRKSSW
jgi:hypothetical protein